MKIIKKIIAYIKAFFAGSSSAGNGGAKRDDSYRTVSN